MIDQDDLTRQTAGDIALQHELLTLFLTQVTQLGERVKAAVATPDTAQSGELPTLLHRIRGAALAVGAREFAHYLCRAEELLSHQPSSCGVLEDIHREVSDASTRLAGLIAARKCPGLAKAGESR